MKLSYYPGCTLKSHAQSFDASTVGSLAQLGVEAEELDRWNCCGTVHGLTSDDLMHRMAPITNLIRAKEAAADGFFTGCAMCYNTLKRANRHVQEDPSSLKIINDFLSLESTDYRGDVEVLHLFEVLRDRIGFEEIAKRVVRPLAGLKVACYYGCMLVRPRDIAIDQVENPRVMEDLIAALGATPVEFPLKTECCGGYHSVGRPDVIAGCTDRIVASAERQGADVVVVSCPLCAHNLDSGQTGAESNRAHLGSMPVLYITQLMAIALGCEPDVLHLETHQVDPVAPLAGLGLL